MSKHLSINENNLSCILNHIKGEFESKSWWPGEGPLQASEEFQLVENSPEKLTEWCHKWLDTSQWRLLEKAVEKEEKSREA
jgi:hypothetical protein